MDGARDHRWFESFFSIRSISDVDPERQTIGTDVPSSFRESQYHLRLDIGTPPDLLDCKPLRVVSLEDEQNRSIAIT